MYDQVILDNLISFIVYFDKSPYSKTVLPFFEQNHCKRVHPLHTRMRNLKLSKKKTNKKKKHLAQETCRAEHEWREAKAHFKVPATLRDPVARVLQ